MKTLILFGTKHGCTKQAAEQLAGHLPGGEVVNIAQQPSPDLAAYDTVLIGSSIYVGQINKALAEFLTSNLAALQQKRIGLFVCCGQEEKALTQLETGFPQELVQAAVAKGYFGYDFTRLGFAEKMLCKAIGAPIGKKEIRSADIERFAQAVTAEA